MTFISKHKITRILALPVAAPLLFMAWVLTASFTAGNEETYGETLRKWIEQGPAA